MDSRKLSEGFSELDVLSRVEYHDSLRVVLEQQPDDRERLLRVGRLIGVLIKEPLAKARNEAEPSETTHAWRSWHLNSAEALDSEPGLENKWQYVTLEALRNDSDVIDALGYQPGDVYSLAYVAHDERGFFSFLALSCSKYLCKNQQLRQEIQEQVDASRKAGLNIVAITPEAFATSASIAIANLLTATIPVLAIVGPGVIAGLIVIIYNIGMDAFCAWASQSAVREMTAHEK